MTGPRGFPIPDIEGAKTTPFGMAELVCAAKRLPGGKAPGSDLVHNEVLKVFVKEDPESMLAIVNLCWTHATFPRK